MSKEVKSILYLAIYSLVVAILGLLGSMLQKEPRIRVLAFVFQIPLIIFIALYIFK